MDLADSGKRPSYTKPEGFDHKFGDSAYLATNVAKSRLRGYLTTFGYVALCGLLLLVGGGTFFIYESVAMNNLPTLTGYDPDTLGISMSERGAVIKEKNKYAQKFQVIAFVFIGVGAVLFVIGAPLAMQFWRRYKMAKNSERSPILDHFSEYKTTANNPRVSSECAMTDSRKTKKMIVKGKRKSKAGWMYRTVKTRSSEGFRFAAHRHPSMNQITIDGSGFFHRHPSENSSTGSTDEELPVTAAPPKQQQKKGGSIKGFFKQLFATDNARENVEVHGRENNRDSLGNEASTVVDRREGTRESVVSNVASTSNGNQAFDSNEESRVDYDGLYNLGQ